MDCQRTEITKYGEYGLIKDKDVSGRANAAMTHIMAFLNGLFDIFYLVIRKCKPSVLTQTLNPLALLSSISTLKVSGEFLL